MDKIDFKKGLKHLYKPSSKKVVAVHVPEMNFCMLDGQGDPNTSSSYAQAIVAQYPPAMEVSPGELVDNLLSIFEGAVILSRIDANTGLLARQLLHHRNYLEFLFARHL